MIDDRCRQRVAAVRRESGKGRASGAGRTSLGWQPPGGRGKWGWWALSAVSSHTGLESVSPVVRVGRLMPGAAGGTPRIGHFLDGRGLAVNPLVRDECTPLPPANAPLLGEPGWYRGSVTGRVGSWPVLAAMANKVSPVRNVWLKPGPGRAGFRCIPKGLESSRGWFPLVAAGRTRCRDDERSDAGGGDRPGRRPRVGGHSLPRGRPLLGLRVRRPQSVQSSMTGPRLSRRCSQKRNRPGVGSVW